MLNTSSFVKSSALHFTLFAILLAVALGDVCMKENFGGMEKFWRTRALITYDEKYNQIGDCSCVMITPNVYLTAAHCFDNFNFSFINVDGILPIEMTSIQLHPNYNATNIPPEHDLALFSTYQWTSLDIKNHDEYPLELFYGNPNLVTTPLTPLYSVGYGKRTHFKYGELDISVNIGRDAFKIDPPRVLNDYFVQGFHRESCERDTPGVSGDSGGPLTYFVGTKEYIVGITSCRNTSENNDTLYIYWSVLDYKFIGKYLSEVPIVELPSKYDENIMGAFNAQMKLRLREFERIIGIRMSSDEIEIRVSISRFWKFFRCTTTRRQMHRLGKEHPRLADDSFQKGLAKIESWPNWKNASYKMSHVTDARNFCFHENDETIFPVNCTGLY